MSDLDSDYDERAHEKLLKSIQTVGGKFGTKRKRIDLKKNVREVSANELLSTIHSTRNLDAVKKDMQKKTKKTKKKKGVDDKKTDEISTLATPLHRVANERIQSKVAYSETRRDLDVWSSVVQENRLADQIVFPIEQKEFIDQSSVQQLEDLKPRTSLEIEMAKVLGTTKNNLRNDVSYTEAELELLKAMSLKEAKAKCAQLQKMRALVSYRDAKLRRQAKIKSKTYHRHLKKQKRKQLIKEFDELLVKDPESAKEKLAEIERQRILERATLKHRNGSKRIQMLARHASKDTNAKRALEEQIRLGRELAGKHASNGIDSDDTDDESAGIADSALTQQQLLEKVAEIASREETLQTCESNPTLRESLLELRQQQKQLSEKSAENAKYAVQDSENTHSNLSKTDQNAQKNDEKIWEEDNTWNDDGTLRDENCASAKQKKSQTEEMLNASLDNEDAIEKDPKELPEKAKLPSKEMRKKTKKKRTAVEKSVDVEQLFDSTEKCLIESTSEEAKRIRLAEENNLEDERNRYTIGDDELANGTSNADSAGNVEAMIERVKRRKEKEKEGEKEVDISLDPKHFLKAETNAIVQLSADLVDRADEFDAEAEQEALVAVAFEDDDVVGDFETEKALVEEREKPKDVDLNLQGWGSWAGPGINPKRSERFILKGKAIKRKDRDRRGLIISEAVDSSIDKVQPRSVPFPYTTVEDYETVVRQPLGKEWNPQRIHHKLVKPTILTRAGRIIKPLDKEETLKEHVKEVSDEEN